MLNLVKRPRRIRNTAALRAMVRETSISTNDFIYPLFVVPGYGIAEEIEAMPGVYRYSPDKLQYEIEEIVSLGIQAVLLFGVPEHKDASGSGAYAADGIVQTAVRKIKQLAPELCVITDVCLCGYTDHGHCGLLINDRVDNDLSVEAIAKTALSHVQAGADMVAPSDMMDGRIQRIRQLLDEQGYTHIPLMAYSVKYESAFYKPFRLAAHSTPQFGDRKSYQMDYCNSNEAMREIELDIAEGADIIMIKPAMAYLDVIYRAKESFNCPLAAYNVSGEYSMIKAAAKMGLINERQAVQEILTGIKRAGADIIITYFAKDMARWLKEGR